MLLKKYSSFKGYTWDIFYYVRIIYVSGIPTLSEKYFWDGKGISTLFCFYSIFQGNYSGQIFCRSHLEFLDMNKVFLDLHINAQVRHRHEIHPLHNLLLDFVSVFHLCSQMDPFHLLSLLKHIFQIELYPSRKFKKRWRSTYVCIKVCVLKDLESFLKLTGHQKVFLELFKSYKYGNTYFPQHVGIRLPTEKRFREIGTQLLPSSLDLWGMVCYFNFKAFTGREVSRGC